MTKEGCWRATLIDRMHGRNVRAKELAALSGVPLRSMKNYLYGDHQPALYTGLRLLDALGVRTVQAALEWYDEEHEEVMY